MQPVNITVTAAVTGPCRAPLAAAAQTPLGSQTRAPPPRGAELLRRRKVMSITEQGTSLSANN